MLYGRNGWCNFESTDSSQLTTQVLVGRLSSLGAYPVPGLIAIFLRIRHSLIMQPTLYGGFMIGSPLPIVNANICNRCFS
jgi:hypothetical protein